MLEADPFANEAWAGGTVNCRRDRPKASSIPKGNKSQYMGQTAVKSFGKSVCDGITKNWKDAVGALNPGAVLNQAWTMEGESFTYQAVWTKQDGCDEVFYQDEQRCLRKVSDWTSKCASSLPALISFFLFFLPLGTNSAIGISDLPGTGANLGGYFTDNCLQVSLAVGTPLGAPSSASAVPIPPSSSQTSSRSPGPTTLTAVGV